MFSDTLCDLIYFIIEYYVGNKRHIIQYREQIINILTNMYMLLFRIQSENKKEYSYDIIKLWTTNELDKKFFQSTDCGCETPYYCNLCKEYEITLKIVEIEYKMKKLRIEMEKMKKLIESKNIIDYDK